MSATPEFEALIGIVCEVIDPEAANWDKFPGPGKRHRQDSTSRPIIPWNRHD